jgi:hypothetical protein
VWQSSQCSLMASQPRCWIHLGMLGFLTYRRRENFSLSHSCHIVTDSLALCRGYTHTRFIMELRRIRSMSKSTKWELKCSVDYLAVWVYPALRLRVVRPAEMSQQNLRYELLAGMSTLTLVCVCCLIGVLKVSVGVAVYFGLWNRPCTYWSLKENIVCCHCSLIVKWWWWAACLSVLWQWDLHTILNVLRDILSII